MKKKGVVLQLKINLIGTKPLVWRRILVSADYTFFDLHVAIQDSFGWTDSHLHQFLTANPYKRNAQYKCISFPFQDALDEIIDERKTKLIDWLKNPKDMIFYEYDFGDGWTHEVKVEKVVIDEPSNKLPQLVDGANACPPEDCGGLGGYAHLLEVLASPKHEDHEGMLDWLGLEDPEEFDPEKFNVCQVCFRNPKKVLKQFERNIDI